MDVVLVPYDPAWPDRAAALVAGLRDVLGRRARRIEHIGSTAIPGRAAKDVIDLQVSVGDLESAARDFDDQLRSKGFRRVPYETDHIPAGREAPSGARYAPRTTS